MKGTKCRLLPFFNEEIPTKIILNADEQHCQLSCMGHYKEINSFITVSIDFEILDPEWVFVILNFDAMKMLLCTDIELHACLYKNQVYSSMSLCRPKASEFLSPNALCVCKTKTCFPSKKGPLASFPMCDPNHAPNNVLTYMMIFECLKILDIVLTWRKVQCKHWSILLYGAEFIYTFPRCHVPKSCNLVQHKLYNYTCLRLL